MIKLNRHIPPPQSLPLNAAATLMLFGVFILPAAAQSSFDPVSTFVPIGHKEDEMNIWRAH